MKPAETQKETIDSFTVAQLRLVKPNLISHIEASFIDTYEAFLTYLYEELDEIICDMEANRDQFQAKNEAIDYNEDAISNYIMFGLRRSKIFTALPVEIAGRTDICITFQGERWRWIGEAKFDKNYSYVAGGFKQLTTRYASFDPEQREGGILIYCKTHPMATFSSEFREKLECCTFLEKETLLDHKISTKNCTSPYRSEFSFFTESTLPDLGGEIRYKARIMPIGLRHLPQDKSGMKSEMYIQRRKAIKDRGGIT